MDVIPGLAAIPRLASPVVSIGMFDGVHRGHQRIIEIAVERSRAVRVSSVVVTFDRHPLEIVMPGRHPRMLTTVAQKLRLLEELDVSQVLLIHFDEEVARIAAEDFLKDVIGARLKASCVVIGENFRFGQRAAGDVDFLRQVGAGIGIEVVSVPLIAEEGTVISSTCIRRLLEEGSIERANAALGPGQHGERLALGRHLRRQGAYLQDGAGASPYRDTYTGLPR